MIQGKLDWHIHAHFLLTYKVPTLIVMHPKTWIDLTTGLFDGQEVTLGVLKYKGIQVFRSLDLNQDDFELA